MMNQVTELEYAGHKGFQAVSIPYEGDDLSMLILVPDMGAFDTFVAGFDDGEMENLMTSLEPTNLKLSLPKFEFDSAIQLKEALMSMGMIDAFGDADFSGIDGTLELFIDEIYHKGWLSVDEAGTEAAAASAVVMSRKGMPIVEAELEINRPFLYLIRDNQTGAILFLGHVVNPAS
jgi:serpin B